MISADDSEYYNSYMRDAFPNLVKTELAESQQFSSQMQDRKSSNCMSGSELHQPNIHINIKN